MLAKLGSETVGREDHHGLACELLRLPDGVTVTP